MACRRQERITHHATKPRRSALQTRKLSMHRNRYPWFGEYAPPFKSSTSEYAKWYRSVQYAARRDGCQNWPEYFAQAKAEAFRNPPVITLNPRTKRGIFGGAGTRAYKQWYYQTLRACLAAGGNDWPAWFAKAKEVEMRRQGLLPSPEPVPLTPTSSPFMDAPLMFDFALPEDRDEGWR